MSGHEWAEIVGAAGLLILFTAVMTMVVWQVGATRRAKVILGREDEYRRMADTATRQQENSERELAQVNARLTELQTRMDAIERILKEVD